MALTADRFKVRVLGLYSSSSEDAFASFVV